MPKKRLPRDALALVEGQIGKWKVQATGAGDRQPPKPQPLITVSREFGSFGAEVGQLVAQDLGFSFWDQELVHAVAEQTGAREALLMSLDERSRSHIEDFVTETLVGASGTVAEYVRQVIRVVRSIERHGGAVVIGRGAQFILAPGAALRVRAVCPFEKRVADYAGREDLSTEEAERRVRQGERDRQSFYRRHYAQHVAEAAHYDLVINTGSMVLEACAETVIAAYRAKFGSLTDERA
jgi:cytidylate kinase